MGNLLSERIKEKENEYETKIKEGNRLYRIVLYDI